MRQFSELNIKVAAPSTFTGDKIKMSRILNRSIIVNDSKIGPSKHNNGDCLHLSITINGKQHVAFTGSTYLIEAIKQIKKEDFPFETTIIEIDDRYEFS